MYIIHHADFLSKEDLAIQWIYSGQMYHMFLYFYYYFESQINGSICFAKQKLTFSL